VLSFAQTLAPLSKTLEALFQRQPAAGEEASATDMAILMAMSLGTCAPTLGEVASAGDMAELMGSTTIVTKTKPKLLKHKKRPRTPMRTSFLWKVIEDEISPQELFPEDISAKQVEETQDIVDILCSEGHSLHISRCASEPGAKDCWSLTVLLACVGAVLCVLFLMGAFLFCGVARPLVGFIVWALILILQMDGMLAAGAEQQKAHCKTLGF